MPKGSRRRNEWVGRRFGKLMVIADDDPIPGHRRILCRCDCGTEKTVNSRNLLNGTKSCGCSILTRPKTYGLQKRRNRIGKRYGKLLVIADDDPTPGIKRKILVRCDCGVEKRVGPGGLLNGKTVSCGCAHKKYLTHGMSDTPTYSSWRSAINRCRNPRGVHYAEYGGSGICFSDRWNRFEDFLEDMGIRPGLGYTLDRIDPEGHYQPGNCQWAERSMQRRNQTRKPKGEFSRFKGVHKHQGKFSAMISVKNRTVRLGEFTDEVSAAQAYDKAAVKYHKEKAVTNAMLGRL